MSALRALPLVSLILLAFVFPAGAWTSRTLEGSALGNIGSLIKVFESEKKRLPESWEELGEFCGKPLDETFPHVLPTRRYQLFSPLLELRLHESRSLQVVAMTRKAMWETTRKGSWGGTGTVAIKGPGRYVLHRVQDDGFFIRWFDESEIQRLWPGTGQAFPVPDQEPERPWVTRTRMEILLKRVGLGSLAAFAAAWVVGRRFMKRRNEPIGV